MVYKKTANKKRWSVAVGGSFMGASANAKFNSRGVGKRSLDSEIKRIIHKEDVAQHKVINEVPLTLAHQTIYSLNPLGNIVRGVNNNNRIGDEIFLEAIKLKGIILTNGTSANTVHLRLMLIKTKQQYLGASDTWGSGVGSTDLFLATSSNLTIGELDPKLCTKVYDHTHTLSPLISTQTLSKEFDLLVPIKQRFIFQTGTNFGKFVNYYWVATAFQFGATSGTTTVALLNMNSDLIFKNSA